MIYTHKKQSRAKEKSQIQQQNWENKNYEKGQLFLGSSPICQRKWGVLQYAYLPIHTTHIKGQAV